MFILTSVAMIIVVFVWLAHFNDLVAGFSVSQPSEPGRETGFTFWQTMKSGLAAIYVGLTDKLRWLGEVLNEPREYIITPR